MNAKITIIGIGDDGMEGLTRQAREIVEGAGKLFGPQRLLDKVSAQLGPSTSISKQALSPDLDQTVSVIQESLREETSQSLVMLASGDPLFYGTSRYLCEQIGEEHFEVLPHVSTMQLAFARVKESWDEAYLTNLATQSIPRVVERVRIAEKVGVFTSDDASPGVLAQALIDQQIDYFDVYICENLGSKDERVTRGTLEEIAKQTFSSLNVMILVRQPGVPDRPKKMLGKKLFGNPDECFLQSQPKRGLLTQCEVRVLALAEMDLGPSSISWDVGAGSGSVAIEAAQLSPSGHVYAIEMDAEDYNLLVENSRTFGTSNLTPILGEAPQAWAELPDPDAIFVGGTGRAVVGIVSNAWERLKPAGRLVVQLANLDNLTALVDHLRQLGCDSQVMMANIARSQEQLETLKLESANPSFLVIAKKSE